MSLAFAFSPLAIVVNGESVEGDLEEVADRLRVFGTSGTAGVLGTAGGGLSFGRGGSGSLTAALIERESKSVGSRCAGLTCAERRGG